MKESMMTLTVELVVCRPVMRLLSWKELSMMMLTANKPVMLTAKKLAMLMAKKLVLLMAKKLVLLMAKKLVTMTLVMKLVV